MKKILFPYDFSETSLNAFRYALHLAAKINAEIVTLHVYTTLPGAYTNFYDVVLANYGVSEWTKFEEYKGEVPKLREIADQEQLSSVVLSHTLQEGSAVDTILERSKVGDVVCIVMGTTGASGIKEVFLGTTADQVMDGAECAVLAVPAKARYRPIRNILFLSKFKDRDIPQLKLVQKIAGFFKAGIRVLNIKPNHEENEDEVIRQFRKDLQGSDIHFHILANSDVEATINDFVEIDGTDIIVLPVHHKNFFKNLFLYSLSRKLVFHSDIPVLGLRAQNHLN